MTEHSKGILLKVLALALFALMDVILKQLSDNYGSFQVAFFRGITALPVVFVILQWQGGVAKLKTPQWRLHLVRGVLGVSMLSAIIYAFSQMKLADAYAIFYAAPLFVTLLSVFILKEHVGRHRWMALAIGMVGVMIMLNPGNASFSLAALACLYGTVAYAGLVIIMKILHRTESTAVQAFYFTLSITVGAGLLAIFNWQPVRLEDAWLLLGLGVSAASAQYVMTDAYGRAPASLLAPYEYTAMIWGLLFGFMFWREVPTLVMVFGAIIVGSSGLYILYRERVHARRGEVITHPPEIDKP
jgi:drug/metabolite transporter (DMT)-like permease